MLEQIIVVVHLVVAVAIVGMILIQHGKGADAGASFGSGGSQTVFGGQGSGNFLTKSTTLLAMVFFSSSMFLAVIAKDKASSLTTDDIPVVEESADIPSAPIDDIVSDIPSVDLVEKITSGMSEAESLEDISSKDPVMDVVQEIISDIPSVDASTHVGKNSGSEAADSNVPQESE